MRSLVLTAAAGMAACLGVPVTDPSVANYSLTFDSDTSALHVIRNCDALEICALPSLQTGATATKAATNGYTSKRRCTYDLNDFGKNDLDGAMIGKESESYDYDTEKFGSKTSCKGHLDYDGLACTLSFRSGKLFDLDNGCAF